MGKKKKSSGAFLKQGAILAAAGMITKIIGLAYRIPMINIMGDDGQGFYGFAFEIYSIALLLTSYSLPLAVSKLVSARRAKGQRKNAYRVFKTALLLAICSGGGIGLIVFFGANFIATYIMTSPLSAYALRVLAPGLFIVAIMGVVRGYFQGTGTMIPTAISQVLEQIINAIVSIAGAAVLFKTGTKIGEKIGEPLMGPAYSAAGGTIGTVAGAGFALLFLGFVYFLYRKQLRRQLRYDRTRNQESYSNIIKILLITIVPVILSTAVYNISQVLDLVIFSKLMTTQGATEKVITTLRGMFSGKYNTLINVPVAMANALGASVIPSLSAAYATKDKNLIHQKINLATRFSMIVAIPCAVGFLVLAEPIMNLLYNGDTATPALMLRIGAITVVFYCLSTVTNAMLQGIDRMTVPVKNASLSLLIHITAVILMLITVKNNIYAVVIGNIIFSASMSFLNANALHRYAGYHQELKKTFVIPTLAAGIMGIATFAIYALCSLFLPGAVATLTALLVAIITYAVALLLLKGLTADEITSLPKGTAILRLCRKLHLVQPEEVRYGGMGGNDFYD